MRYVGVTELCETAGISARQADYWTRRGWIVAENAGRGSGRRRQWSEDEVHVARFMARATESGIRPDFAAQAARHDGWLKPGVRLVLEPV